MTDNPAQVRRTLYGDDCLNVLNDELALPTDSVDLIYLDPPFNSKNKYNLPFKGKDKDTRPVEAFTDTWTWGDKEETLLEQFGSGPSTRRLADIVRLAQMVGGGGGGSRRYSLAAYLLNMAVRLIPMRRVLKPTGSIYLHCDHTAGHYLKLLMDAVFGMQNFRNEIVWCYTGPSNTPRWFPQKHDTVFWYSKGGTWTFNRDAVRVPYDKETLARRGRVEGVKSIIADSVETQEGRNEEQVAELFGDGKVTEDWWPDIPILTNQLERLGYPTQKPFALLQRIIKASSNKGDVVLDPFCGCGTTVHAAESLGRQWIGIDISSFSVGLIRERVLSNFPNLTAGDVESFGVPTTVADARALAAADKFEFEKWVCGAIGAEGMFHEPGTRGADGGIDGVIKFYPIPVSAGKRLKVEPEYAIVQVKGGHVTPDAVRALKATVDKYEARAGVMVCFNEYMGTVENQRFKSTFSDAVDEYPVIQGLSIERLLADERPHLPLYGRQRRGGLVDALL